MREHKLVWNNYGWDLGTVADLL